MNQKYSVKLVLSVEASASFVIEAERCLVNKADNYNKKKEKANGKQMCVFKWQNCLCFCIKAPN